MPSIIYFSNPALETLYPVTLSEQSLPNQHLLGKPVALRVVDTLLENSTFDLVIAYPHISGEVRDAVEGKAEMLDTADMTLWEGINQACLKASEDEVILILGTHIFSQDFLDGLIVNWEESGRRPLLGIIAPEESIMAQGILRVNVEVDFIEKRVTKAVDIGSDEKPVSSYSFSGAIMARKKWCIDNLSGGGDLYEHLLSLINREKPSFYHYTGRFVPLNNPWSLLEAIRSLLNNVKGVNISDKAKVSPTAVIEGPVIIDDNAFIDHYSVIKGPVYIGRNSLVGAHSFIRSYTSVEEHATIGSGAEVKRSYIGRKATIGSKSHVTDSIVGEEATIRPLVVTLNYDPKEAIKGGYVKRGSIIGYRSLVNGGTVIPPRKRIGPRSVYP